MWVWPHIMTANEDFSFVGGGRWGCWGGRILYFFKTIDEQQHVDFLLEHPSTFSDMLEYTLTIGQWFSN